MAVKELENFYFSQTAIKTYLTCPLDFRSRYLDKLIWPSEYNKSEQQQAQIERGQVFHTLANRYFLGISSQGKVEPGSEAREYLERLEAYLPLKDGVKYLPEYELRYNQDGIRLLAKFDLLYIDNQNGEVIIYDWKTGDNQPEASYYKGDIQTILYQFILVEAGGRYLPADFKPGDLKMVYWNPNFPGTELELGYSSEQHQENRNYLYNIIEEILELEYQEYAELTPGDKCYRCNYRPICEGEQPEESPVVEDDLDLDLDWEMLEEIKFHN